MIKSRAKYFAIFSWRQFVGLVSQLVAAARLGLHRVRDAEAEDGAGSSGAVEHTRPCPPQMSGSRQK